MKSQYATHASGKGHVCKECNKSFMRKSNLNDHYFIHTDKKPHVCDVCNKGFIYKSLLTMHAFIHTGNKPHTCDVCNKGFTQKSHLKRHAYIHTGAKPHVCDVCNNGFNSKDELKRHTVIHTDQKRHKCDICQKGFNYKSCLKRHRLIHTGQRLHFCDVCQQGFAHKHNLKRHYLTHTKEKNHICEICKRGFADKSELNKHLLLCVKRENKKRLKLQIKKDEENHAILRIHEDGSVLEEHTAEEAVKQQYNDIDQYRNPIIQATAQEHVDETSTDGSVSQDSFLLYSFQQVLLEVAADVTIDQELENVVNQDLNFTHEIIQPSIYLDHQEIVQHVQNHSSQTSNPLLSTIELQTFDVVDQQASSEISHQTFDTTSQQAYSPISNKTFTQYQDQIYDNIQRPFTSIEQLSRFQSEATVAIIADPGVLPAGYTQF